MVLFLFEPPESSPKRFIFAMLLSALLIGILAVLHWPA